MRKRNGREVEEAWKGAVGSGRVYRASVKENETESGGVEECV